MPPSAEGREIDTAARLVIAGDTARGETDERWPQRRQNRQGKMQKDW